MKWYNIWSWPSQLISDYKEWRVVMKALKEPEVIQGLKTYQYELRVDKIGRIYTVINLPEELWELDKKDMVWPWMLEQLRELDELLMTLRLNDLVYPDVSPYPGAPAYVVKLVSSRESLSFGKFFKWVLNCGFLTLAVYLINAISGRVFSQSIYEFLISLF